MLKALGRSTGKSDYQWLHDVLLRLQTCAVEIYKRKHIYARSLVAKFDIDETSRCFKVTIDPDMIQVYTAGWTSIDWEQRQQLRQAPCPVAAWLLCELRRAVACKGRNLARVEWESDSRGTEIPPASTGCLK